MQPTISINPIFSEIKIRFSIHKKVEYGKAIYVSGNLSQFGNWNIEKSLRLEWNQDNIWSGTVTFPAYIYDSFLFKYAISSYDDPFNQKTEWQNGMNRKVTIENDKKTIICKHKWNKQKITLNLCLEDIRAFDQYYVIGNISELGRWKINNQMKKEISPNSHQKFYQKTKTQKQLNQLSPYNHIYSYTFYVYKRRESFQYLFIKKGQQISSQRYPGRIFIYEKANNDPNRIKTCYNNGNIQIFDKSSFNELKISNITQNIFVGSYLQSAKDIKILKEKGITAILSIQTQQDYQSHNLWPQFIRRQCQRQGLSFHSSQIEDKNPRDFVQKSFSAFSKMQGVLRQGSKLYVHCSAGMYRSPQVIALYLILVQQYSIESAIETIKDRHPLARPSYVVICSAVDQILCRFQNKRVSL